MTKHREVSELWPQIEGYLERMACGCYVTQSAAQSIPGSTWTSLSFGTEVFDQNGCWFSNYPTRLYAPVRGIYVVTAGWCRRAAQNPTATYQAIYLRVDGTAPPYYGYNILRTIAGTDITVATAAVISLNRGSYVEVMAYHTDSSARSSSGDYRTYAAMGLVYPTPPTGAAGTEPPGGGGGGGGGGWDGTTFRLLHPDGTVLAEYEGNETGLRDAITNAAAGDTIWFPARTVTLTSSLALPAGVALVGIVNGRSGLQGDEVVLADGSLLLNLQIQHYHTSGMVGNAYALTAASSGWARLEHCEVSALVQAGYEAAGLYLASDKGQFVEFYDCVVTGYAESGGTAYAAKRDLTSAGSAHFYGCRLYGTTDIFKEG